ncbi:hypothetical protein GQX74_009836 [Glossina fuscipes]|nr:hypothetical protein GQX74_009836 [Glossina fuscipes]
MHNFFVRLKSQFNAFATTSTIPASPATPNAIVKEERASSLPYDVTGRIIKQRRHNSAPDMELQRTRSLKAIRVRKVSKGSLKSVRRGTVCVTVSTHASSVFYNTEIEVIVAAICCKRLTDTVIRDSVLILKFFICWGDYIKHPVLYELSHKYGFTDNLPESALPDRLEEIKEAIRREIRKELKIKEGAEKLREVAKDRRSLNDVATIVKKSNSKIAELKSELQELESQILLTQGNTAVTNNGRDILLPNALSQGSLGSNSQSSDRNNGGSGDGLISGGHEQLSANDKLMLSLEKQLNIEMKVKNGAENMIQSLQSGHYGRDKKLLAEAQQMLTDSKAKIEFLRLRILKVKQNKEHANKLAAQIVANAEENGGSGVGGVGGLMPQRLETSLEERIEELRHRLRIEAAVVDGAKNVIRILQNNKVPDKKALQEGFSVYPPVSQYRLLPNDETSHFLYSSRLPNSNFISLSNFYSAQIYIHLLSNKKFLIKIDFMLRLRFAIYVIDDNKLPDNFVLQADDVFSARCVELAGSLYSIAMGIAYVTYVSFRLELFTISMTYIYIRISLHMPVTSTHSNWQPFDLFSEF